MALSCYRIQISREVAIIIKKQKNTIVLYVIHLSGEIMVIHPFDVNIFRDQKKSVY